MSEIRRVEPGIWLIESETEGFDVRACLVLGEERAILWDTLFSPASLAGVGELVRDRPLTVVYSHGDWDHVWGTGGLGREPEAILAHQACLPRFEGELPELLEEKRRGDPETFGDVRLFPPTRSVGKPLTLTMDDGLSLELHFLPGHTPDSMVGFLPDRGILLGGDAVELPLPFLNAGGRLEDWAERLEGWAAHPELRQVIPAHGRMGGRELLVNNASYLRSILGGREPRLPEDLSPFYRETHAANLEMAKVGR